MIDAVFARIAAKPKAILLPLVAQDAKHTSKANGVRSISILWKACNLSRWVGQRLCLNLASHAWSLLCLRTLAWGVKVGQRPTNS